MSKLQGDLFGPETPVVARPSEETLKLVRARLNAALDLVRLAETMPWDDQLAIIREDNAFRYAKSLLPSAEAEALWVEFDAHMDRLYAVMNAGLPMPEYD